MPVCPHDPCIDLSIDRAFHEMGQTLDVGDLHLSVFSLRHQILHMRSGLLHFFMVAVSILRASNMDSVAVF